MANLHFNLRYLWVSFIIFLYSLQEQLETNLE